MAAAINKELAEKIAKKFSKNLETAISTSQAHQVTLVFYEGKVVAHVGIRRGSSKEAGHGHIPKDMHVQQGFAKLFGQCKKTVDEWITLMKETGKI